MDYWNRKEELSKKAALHTKEMDRRCGELTNISVVQTKVYGYPDRRPHGPFRIDNYPEKIIAETDSVSAIFKYFEGRTCVLNFASYKNPGGKFIQGSSAQEESLCHFSNLYNILRCFDGNYYEWNRKHLNGALYTDRALYTPDVVFFNEKQEYVKCDVLTCAAPNFTAASRYCNVSRNENSTAFESRISFIKNIAEESFVDTMILGAFGCGVFGQDPREAAALFYKIFNMSGIKKIVYAIPGGKNLEAFVA